MAKALAALVLIAATATGARAEPIIGTAASLGRPLADGEAAHLGASLYALGQLADSNAVLGGELSGSLEGYSGSYGCGRVPAQGGEPIPSIAVSCLQPTVAAHALFGTRRPLSRLAMLGLEGGLGATLLFLVPGQGGDSDATVLPSALLRAQILFGLGEMLGGQWRAGLQLQERALGISETRFAGSVGLLLEAAVID